MKAILRGSMRRNTTSQSKRVLKRACSSALRDLGPQRLETLEDRRLLSVVTQDAGADYIAFEAELATLNDPNVNGHAWRVIGADQPETVGLGTTASAGQALYANTTTGGKAGDGSEGYATYNLNFDSAGDYRMYVRRKVYGQDGGANSMYRPNVLDNPTGWNTFDNNTDWGVLGDTHNVPVATTAGSPTRPSPMRA